MDLQRTRELLLGAGSHSGWNLRNAQRTASSYDPMTLLPRAHVQQRSINVGRRTLSLVVWIRQREKVVSGAVEKSGLDSRQVTPCDRGLGVQPPYTLPALPQAGLQGQGRELHGLAGTSTLGDREGNRNHLFTEKYANK